MLAEASDLATLSKTELAELLAETYARAKPINDDMVDVSLEVLTISTEIYRRAVAKHLPGTSVDNATLVLRIGCNINPLSGLPILVRRLAECSEAGIEISRVEFETTSAEFRFYAVAGTSQPSVQPESEP